MAARLFWHAVLWANWAIILVQWWSGLGNTFSAGGAAIAIAFGRLAGLSAAYLVLQQFFFTGRMPWLERVFGLDNLTKLHHQTGKWGILLLLSHPILLVYGYAGLSGASPWKQFLTFAFGPGTSLAAIAMLLFVGVVVSSLVIVRKRLRYESWYYVHLATYLAVGLAFVHQVQLGSDVLSSRLFSWYWVGLFSAVMASQLAFRFVMPLRAYFRHHFRIERIVRETKDVVSLFIGGDAMGQFAVQPGQFVIVRMLVKGMWWQAHPFSVSAVPDGRTIRLTIKELGDYTRHVGRIPEGAKVMIEGPYGIFTEGAATTQKALLIAGGIGITPIRSLMQQMLEHGKDAVLLYGNRTSSDIVFDGELRELGTRHGAKVIHIISHDDAHEGVRGKIDEEKIRTYAPDVAARDVYLCGPGPMRDMLVPILRKLGVPPSRIHYEKFSLA
jgi:predicted ferric reductase